MNSPLVSIIIVSWNTRDLLRSCLQSIGEGADGLEIETIVIDNGSTDGSLEMVREQFPGVRLFDNPNNLGFAAANNYGMGQASGRYLLLLNSDAELHRGTLKEGIKYLESNQEVGVVGVRLLNPDGSFQGSYAEFPTIWIELLLATGLGARLNGPHYPAPDPNEDHDARSVDWIGGAFMLLRREVLEQAGGMDETYWMYSEETDWCYRIREAGWEVHYLPQLTITHVQGASTSQRPHEMMAQLYKSKIRFFAKHYGPIPARRLRTLLRFVFLCRELYCRVIAGARPSKSRNLWYERYRAARHVRSALSVAQLPQTA